MAVPALLIGTAAVILMAAMLIGAKGALQERERQLLAGRAGQFLENVQTPDHETAIGSRGDAQARIEMHHFRVTFEVQLAPAGVPYHGLLDKFGPALRAQLAALDMVLGDDDRVTGAVPRSCDDGDNLATIGLRLKVVDALAELAEHAPRELVDQIPLVRSSQEVDQILDTLTQLYPERAETREAFDVACERYTDKRLAARAAAWRERYVAGC